MRALIAGASFHEITIQPAAGMVRFPSVEHFVRSYVTGSPLAGHVAKVSDDGRAALLMDTASALASFVTAEGLAFPIEAHLASARK